MTLDEIFDIEPFSLNSEEKHAILNDRLRQLTVHHYKNCEKYRRMFDATGLDINNLPEYEQLPFLPVRLFKEFELRSCAHDDVVKTLTSSGTTGQQVSRIFLDREASSYQTKCLTRIVSHFLGTKRVPMLILDSSAVVKNRAMFSARGAGILGFSMFGSKRQYALDNDMELDIEGMNAFLEAHRGETIFLFGFTFMVWQHFYKKLIESGYRPDLSNGILIHGGGWKKLISEKVSPSEFKQALNTVCGIAPENIHDYYGMVEQTGTIYMECKCGHLHTSAFSDVIIRRPHDWSVANFGEKGLIEVVSVLPTSYPGHILLTEDEGIILGEDDCPCGLKGKYFKISGRIKNAEIRGCSDTYAAKF
ncbi:MAG: acyl-protein synthetase [Barnesiella sp.]|nr:acyl-protein synthetase [Barnesiella sp.]